MVWAGWAVTRQEVPRVVGLWLGNFTVHALDGETGSVLHSVRPGVRHDALETIISIQDGGIPWGPSGRMLGMTK